jgi:hypothetical protein
MEEILEREREPVKTVVAIALVGLSAVAIYVGVTKVANVLADKRELRLMKKKLDDRDMERALSELERS